MRVLLPDLVYAAGECLADHAVVIDETSGRITAVVPFAELPAIEGARMADRVRLAGRALFPGFVNAHSHSFQRVIRGRTQWRPAGTPDADFWSWREAMYAAALTLDPDDVYDVARACFLEMLRAGYTAVGEFHYLQRAPDGSAYDDPNELARRVIAAAENVGLRIRLLNVVYAAGGIGAPLSPEQRRFATPSLDDFLAATESLVRSLHGHPLAAVGIAPHSVRAVPRGWFEPLHTWGAEHGLPIHMHVSEQPAEVRACVEAYALRPVQLLAREGMIGPAFTAVHATHLVPDEIALLGGTAATVCLCPTTERDLGDGMPAARELLAAGARLAIGSDSQTIIDPFEEMRLVEYHERLRTLRRVVIGEGEDRVDSARALFRIAGAGGARSLGLGRSEIAAGALADLVAIDLRHPLLEGWRAEFVPALLAFSGRADLVTDVWVNGTRRVCDGRHPEQDDILTRFRTRMLQP